MINSSWQLLSGTATKYVLLGINIILGIFLMPFTIRHLGTTEYGLWMLVASMTAYFQLLDLGYGNGLVRHVAEADALGNVPLVNRILSTFLIVYTGLGLAAAVVVGAMIVWLVPNFPKLLPSQIALARFVLAMIGVRIVVGFPMTVFGAATNARQRFALNNTVAIFGSLANGAATFLLLEYGYRVRAVVAASTVIALLSYVGYAWTAKIAFPEMRLRWSSFSAGLVRDVTAYSVYVFIVDIAIQIGFNLDNVIVGGALGTAAVAVYAITLRLCDYQRQLSSQFNGLMLPVVVRYQASNDPDGLRRMLVEGTRLALTLVCGVTVCMMGFAAPLITRWMGPGFEAAVPPLEVLAIMGVVIVGQQPLGNILLGTGRQRLVAFASLSEALVNLGLSLFLVRHFGLLGVAVGSLIPVAIVNFFVLAPAACREVGIGVFEFAGAVATAPATGAVIAAIAGVALRAWRPPDTIALIFGEGAIVGLVYLLSVWTVGFDANMRAHYTTYARRAVLTVLARRAPSQSV
ncbi:MAG TPA: oligosaccharide flippase family protein [Vicinamibacterales bacterium]|nr:oligosaccharide flippase family protein [Vicinamibacterales bacterium]